MSDLKIVDYNNYAWNKRGKYFASFLIWRKTIQNCLKIDATYWYDHLLLRQETKKK